jgi:hypothetical protein
MSFRFAYLALALVLGGLGCLGFVAVGHGRRPAQPAPPRLHGRTSFDVSRQIARKASAAAPAGTTVVAERPAAMHLAGLQLPVGQTLVQMALAPADVLYQVCGDGPGCALRESPSASREVLLRRLTLGLAAATFSAPHAPQRVLVGLPSGAGQLWLVVYDRAGVDPATLAAARSLLRRAPGRRADAALLSRLTDGRTFAVSGQVVSEDGGLIAVLQPRPCMDAACPGA